MSLMRHMRPGFEPMWVKIAMPIVVSLALFSFTTFAIHLPEVYGSLLEKKKTALEDMAQIVWDMIQFHYTMEVNGALSHNEAQKMVLKAIAAIRFGPQLKDYFWINDLEPRMVMHPYAPDLDGRDLSDYKDFTGKRLFVEMVRASEKTGSAFVSYNWQWQDNKNLIIPKVSYVKRFEPWGWIIGSGIYIDDIRAQAQEQAKRLLYSSMSVLAVVSLLSLFSIWQGLKATRKIRNREATLQGIFDQTKEFMGVLELNGRVRRINRTALEFAGLTQKDVSNRFFWETAWWIDHPEAQKIVHDAVDKARSGNMTVFEARHISHDGRLVIVDVSIQPIKDKDGVPVFILVDGVDITERMRTQMELENNVEERTRELKNSLDALRKAQNQLVQSEKMASLGRLVAGVAHEINTPLGLGVTNATYLQEQMANIREAYEGGRFTKGDFEIFLERADEAVRSMLINLRRGAEIIRSFKQVAVDQEVEERRTFVLREYLDEVIVSLKPKYKRTGHILEIECPDHIKLDTYPGVLMQVLANLIINSLIHGFEGVENGIIRIRAHQQKERVVLEYSDNGRGMPHEGKAKIYDPFYTTKKGKGGTGLGMHIVFNLVTQKLCGNIELETAPGEGVRFTLSLPVKHPGICSLNDLADF